MEKRYFGSFSLQNTIRKVKENYPECRILFKDDGDGKMVTFRFKPEERKKYGLSEGIRTYQFMNGHLILSNGPVDPFKYDKLDELIETSELNYDVEKRKDSIEKIVRALNACQDFHDTAIITIGNMIGKSFDIKLTLNEIERAYHISEESEDVHLQKIDPDIELLKANEYHLSQLPANIKYKILKTTHPGLLTVATEYISGLRDDKADWKSAANAYIKPWKKETYEKMGISPFDVLADVSESRLVGKFVDDPKRRLVLIDGSEYAYSENPLEIVSYLEYKNERTLILNSYKRAVMQVCQETGVIPLKAIEFLNRYVGKPGPVVFCQPEEAIQNIRLERLSDPLAEIIGKINRTVILHSHNGGFLASLRKSKKYDEIRRIDINENGNITRIDIDLLELKISKPYTMNSGRKKKELENLNYLPLTKSFIESMEIEVEKMKNTTEYKTYKYTKELEKLGFEEDSISSDENFNIYKYFIFPNNRDVLFINPYEKTIGSKNRLTNESIELAKNAKQIFENIF